MFGLRTVTMAAMVAAIVLVSGCTQPVVNNYYSGKGSGNGGYGSAGQQSWARDAIDRSFGTHAGTLVHGTPDGNFHMNEPATVLKAALIADRARLDADQHTNQSLNGFMAWLWPLLWILGGLAALALLLGLIALILSLLRGRGSSAAATASAQTNGHPGNGGYHCGGSNPPSYGHCQPPPPPSYGGCGGHSKNSPSGGTGGFDHSGVMRQHAKHGKDVKELRKRVDVLEKVAISTERRNNERFDSVEEWRQKADGRLGDIDAGLERMASAHNQTASRLDEMASDLKAEQQALEEMLREPNEH